MPAIIALLALSLAQAAAPATSPTPAPPRAALPEPPQALNVEERAVVAWTLERGRLLFELDRAAWVGTDDALARIREPERAGLRGYIVEPIGADGAEAYIVTFYGGPAEAPVAYYSGRVENRRVTQSEVFAAAERPALTPAQRRLVNARDIASAAVRGRPCGSAPFNTALVPPATPEGEIDVYFLTPQVRTGDFPFGGHFRVTIGADGRETRQRAFTNSCLTTGPGEGSVGLVITHLLDPLPTEIHVFTAITAGLPVFVAATEPQRLFSVTGESIALVAGEPRRSGR